MMPSTFVSVDVETANESMASICQIGIAKYVDGVLVEEWVSYVNPEDYFYYVNIDIHGITARTVRNSSTFPQIAELLNNWFSNQIVVSHTSFDRVAIQKAFEKYQLPVPDVIWLDSAKVARRTWEDCAWRGYGLAPLAEKIGYSFNHHHALEDAKAAAHILLAAIQKTGLGLEAWLERTRKPIDPSRISSGSAIKRAPNPEGDWFGEVVLFTGALSVPRVIAADLAAQVGCEVVATVSKHITMLVLGDQDLNRLAGKEKSHKHIKVEALIAKGQPIKILSESDFMALVSQ